MHLSHSGKFNEATFQPFWTIIIRQAETFREIHTESGIYVPSTHFKLLLITQLSWPGEFAVEIVL